MESLKRNWRIRWLAATGIALVGLALATTSFAATTSRLTGTVVDNQDQALPGVTVTLSSDVLIGGAQVRITNADGGFDFNLLPPGQYGVRTDLSGFLPAELTARVALDRETQVRIQMVLQEFAGEIEVIAEAPVVDTTQVTTGESYNQEFLQNASVGINGRDYLSVIGNEAGSVGTGNVNVFGGLQSDNVYLVDGLNTTDPLTATFGTNFNFDAIQEVSIQTGGFEAEFGQALGGVVNLVTKSGGNEFSGALDMRYRDQSFAESGDHFDPNDMDSSTRQVSASLGGPIMRDRLWFFASAEQVVNETTQVGSVLTRKYDGINWIGKATWQLSEANRAVMKVSSDPAEITNAGADQFTAADAGLFQEQGGKIFQAELDSVLSDSMLASFQVGINRGYLNDWAMHGDITIPGVYNLDTGIQSESPGRAEFSDRDTDQFKASLSYFVDDLAGAHELKVGAELRQLAFNGVVYFPGNMDFQVMTFDPTGAHGSGFWDSDGDGISDYILYTGLDDADQRVPSDGDLWTYYVQDAWRPASNLTIKPGLRLDATKYANEAGTTIADFDKVQPRLGIVWDITNSGKQVVRASWGRFMHPGSVNLPDLISGRETGTNMFVGLDFWCGYAGLCDPADLEAIFGSPYLYTDPQGDQHNYYYYTTFGADPFESVDTLGVGHLRAPYMDQLIIGYEQQLWSETAFEIQYVDKETTDLFEDTCSNNTWMWGEGTPPSLDDPSTWTNADDCTGYVLANPPGLKREWKGFIAKFETRYKGLHVLGNYTYGKSKGNTGAEAWSSYATGGYDEYPRDWYNFYGYMDDDRRHRVKLNGYMLLPYDFTFGFSGFYSSKPALNRTTTCGVLSGIAAEELSALGLDPGSYDYCNGATVGTLYLEPRGSGRGEASYQLDLQVSKAFRFGGVSLEGVLSVVNALSSERPTLYRETEFTSVEWGSATRYTQPRRYELGVRLEF